MATDNNQNSNTSNQGKNTSSIPPPEKKEVYRPTADTSKMSLREHKEIDKITIKKLDRG